MIQEFLFKALISPIALLYGTGVAIRNALYNIGFLKGSSFTIPIISVGNLTVGGAGKTPHVEYLSEWLSKYIEISILSRGYKRQSKGFLEANLYHRVEQVGDEAVQYKRKFPQLGIYVSESRVLGIPKIIANRPQTQTIILDDGFQHRAVSAGLNILLTEFDRPFTRDYLLPVGRLREWRQGYRRADIIIVTKCPAVVKQEEKDRLILEIGLTKSQHLFFTRYIYGSPYHMFYPSMKATFHQNMHVLVISAIAKTDYLLDYLSERVAEVKSIEYEDHHQFTNYEVAQLKKQFDHLSGDQKIIITTEKDAVRLERHKEYIRQEEMPIYVLPAFVSFVDLELEFRQLIQNYLLQFKS